MTSTPFIVGRQSEVRLLRDMLSGQTRHSVLNIYGPGGIGKTIVGRKMQQHALETGTPFAVADGSQPDLTADRVLLHFATGLRQHDSSGRLQQALARFEQEIQDYLVVQDILQQQGGINAIFDTLGKVKDPVGIGAALARFGRSVSEHARRNIENRFALERYLRGAEQALTASFTAGLADTQNAHPRRLLLLLDTYEEMAALDDWVARTFVPQLPSQVAVVILGRNKLHHTGLDWTDLGHQVHATQLPELDEIDSKAYLRHNDLTDPAQLDHIYRFTGGYPLLLVLVCHLATESGGWKNVGALESASDRDQIASGLLDRILREERVQEVRAFLEKGVVARWFDPEIVSVIMETDPQTSRMMYDQLRRHSFVEPHPYGLKFHDKIRELLLARLEFTSRAEVDQLERRLIAYHSERAQRTTELPDS